MIRAGDLRHRVTLQQPIETQDSFGAVVMTWQNVASVWAAIEDLSGREFFEAEQIASQVSTRVRIRYRADVEPKWRVVFGSRTLDIRAVLDPDGRRRELHLMCAEVS